MTPRQQYAIDTRRLLLVGGMLSLAAFMLMWRAVDLHVISKEFLQTQGDARHLRVVTDHAHRGTITDRNGEPLAISTPIESVWADPRQLMKQQPSWKTLAAKLNITENYLRKQVVARENKEFVYLKRHVSPSTAKDVMSLKLSGVAVMREYRRYYPAGEVASQLIGITNVDDVGQEGIELAYNDVLSSTAGSKRVIKDLLHRVVEDVEQVKDPKPGKDLILSVDRRIQYLAYRELKTAVKKHNSKAGSAVVLNAQTGEVMAMVNLPSFNPNSRVDLKSDRVRNRAVTDVFEPGSTIKPFTAAAALEAGLYRADSIVDTSPGLIRVGRKMIRDVKNYGPIKVSTVIQKSSNVGASKLALSIDPRYLWNMLTGVGFGDTTNVGFPGESSGSLSNFKKWKKIERATLSFGYGVSVTALQLARAYTAFANDGNLMPVSFTRKLSNYGAWENGAWKNVAWEDDTWESDSHRVMSVETARQVRNMLVSVVEKGGTGTNAKVPGYRVAGKTGTAKVSGEGGYIDGSYNSIFVGLAPASDPRLVMAIVINEPQGNDYYGGKVAAPVFAKTMAGALRILDVPPDDISSMVKGKLALLDVK